METEVKFYEELKTILYERNVIRICNYLLVCLFLCNFLIVIFTTTTHFVYYKNYACFVANY